MRATPPPTHAKHMLYASLNLAANCKLWGWWNLMFLRGLLPEPFILDSKSGEAGQLNYP